MPIHGNPYAIKSTHQICIWLTREIMGYANDYSVIRNRRVANIIAAPDKPVKNNKVIFSSADDRSKVTVQSIQLNGPAHVHLIPNDPSNKIKVARRSRIEGAGKWPNKSG